MQREATIERPAVVARLKAAGSAADLLLEKAGEMIEALEAAVMMRAGVWSRGLLRWLRW